MMFFCRADGLTMSNSDSCWNYWTNVCFDGGKSGWFIISEADGRELKSLLSHPRVDLFMLTIWRIKADSPVLLCLWTLPYSLCVLCKSGSQRRQGDAVIFGVGTCTTLRRSRLRALSIPPKLAATVHLETQLWSRPPNGLTLSAFHYGWASWQTMAQSVHYS